MIMLLVWFWLKKKTKQKQNSFEESNNPIKLLSNNFNSSLKFVGFYSIWPKRFCGFNTFTHVLGTLSAADASRWESIVADVDTDSRE